MTLFQLQMLYGVVSKLKVMVNDEVSEFGKKTVVRCFSLLFGHLYRETEGAHEVYQSAYTTSLSEFESCKRHCAVQHAWFKKRNS